MSNSELYLAIGIVATLLVVPLLVMVLVRWLIPLRDDDASADAEAPLEFNSLRDFWESNVPHLRELRDRLLKALLGVALGGVVGGYLVFGRPFNTPLLDILTGHFAPGVTFQGIATAEVFVSLMGVALVIGVALAMPVVVYQIIAFFAPGLYAREKRIVFTSLPFVFELFLAGLVFGWYFTVPAAIQFLTTFGQTTNVIIQPSIADFLRTVSMLMLWNGVIFELPAIIFLLARIGVVNAQMLARTRRYAIVVIVIVAAVITPTGDPYNLLLLAVPMYVLYELGIVLARLVPRPADPSPEPVRNS